MAATQLDIFAIVARGAAEYRATHRRPGRPTEHGHTKHGERPSPTYVTWQGMIARCCNPKDGGYARYGGRGITVCGPWHDFKNFLRDMGERPDGRSLDRIDSKGNYEPGNCKWSTAAEQVRNRSNTVFVTIDGVRRSLGEWAEVSGICIDTLRNRLKSGVDSARLLAPPDMRFSRRRAVEAAPDLAGRFDFRSIA